MVVERRGQARQPREEDDKRLLDAMSQSPESVVDASLRELRGRRRPIVIPGLHNKLLALATGWLPRRALVVASGRVGELA